MASGKYMLKEIKSLIVKEIMLEWKQKYAFNGLLLYVASTVFICYLSFKQIIDPPVWNALFWIILLFAAVNAVAKSFMQETRGRQLYMYTIASAQSVILSKIIYNLLLMLLISLINLLFYSLFIGNIVQDMPMFMLGLLLGSAGFASVLTMISAIASRAGNNTTLMAILSFPILIPMLITIIRFSKNAIDGLAATVNYQFMVMLLGLNVLVVALSFLLFPYLWRE
ncbi:MAG: heme exporter protein CcmB [Bacteroidetes bacterium]|nr:heme exporter protein CcmB [Bacteroidota bacterium]